MILPDVNLLIHSHNTDSPFHKKAIKWWSGCLAGSEGVGLAWVAILGYIRISTHRKILNNPLPVTEVLKDIDTWLRLSHVHICYPSEKHFFYLSKLLSKIGTAGNLTTDAHLASIAIERGYTLYSTDYDFNRFDNLKWHNPIA